MTSVIIMMSHDIINIVTSYDIITIIMTSYDITIIMMSYDIITIIMMSYDIISIILSSLVATSANAGSGTDQSQRTTKSEPIVWDQPSC